MDKIASEVAKNVDSGISERQVKEIVFQIISGSELSAEEIRDKLQTLEGGERLSAKHIKDLDKFVSKTVQVGGGVGSKAFSQLLDTPNNYSGESGKVVTVNSAEDGVEFTTASGGDPKEAWYVFDTVEERDAFFVANPSYLVEDILICIKDTTPPPTPGVRSLDFSEAINSQYLTLLYP